MSILLEPEKKFHFRLADAIQRKLSFLALKWPVTNQTLKVLNLNKMELFNFLYEFIIKFYKA